MNDRRKDTYLTVVSRDRSTMMQQLLRFRVGDPYLPRRSYFSGSEAVRGLPLPYPIEGGSCRSGCPTAKKQDIVLLGVSNLLDSLLKLATRA